MLDEPPIESAPEQPVSSAQVVEAPLEPSARALPSETRADGTVVIDLTPLAPVPETCLDENPDPFNPPIVVCARTEPAPRLGPVLGPPADVLFGRAVPRARLKLSESAEAQANAIKKSVGGFDADGAEVRLKIEF